MAEAAFTWRSLEKFPAAWLVVEVANRAKGRYEEMVVWARDAAGYKGDCYGHAAGRTMSAFRKEG